MFADGSGGVRSLPASWTSEMAPDPYVAMSAGRSIFRVVDLVDLVELVRCLELRGQGEDGEAEQGAVSGGFCR